jgi:nucleosome binding factor SPN SPT16 subunit
VSQRRKDGEEGYIEVRRLNDRYTAFHDAVRSFTEHAETRKVREKAEKKTAKADQKLAKKKAKEEGGDFGRSDSKDDEKLKASGKKYQLSRQSYVKAMRFYCALRVRVEWSTAMA